MKTFRKRVIALLMVICVLLGSFPLQLSLQASAVGGIDSLTCSSFISTASHRQYIDTMMRYYLNNNSKLRTALDNGKNVIFMFEGGSDNYPSYSYSTSSSSNRNQAVCIVIKKNSSGNAYIAFYCENCSSVPCKPKNTGGGAYDGSTTLMDGIYGVYTTSHFGYGALQTTASTGYYTPPSSPNGWVNSANGINVHTRTTNNPVGWSAGCQVIGTSAYSDNPFNQFMKVVTGITYNVWYDYYNGGINGPPSQGVDMGYYVVDRQLGWDGLLNLYNTTALTNITAYSTSAKKAGMNYYYFKCTSYPSYCQIKINSSTSVMSQPCTASTDSSSKVLSTAAANSTYTATKLYKNTAGQLWYEVQLSGSEIGHIPAASTTYVKQLTSDIKISSAGIPSGHVKGDSFIVSGNITSSYNQLSTVSAYIYNGVSTTGTPATGAQATVNGTAYNLAGSTIDNNTWFGAIDVGTYTYVISANYINYYATSGTAMSSNTGKIELVNEYFAVIAAKADQSTCSHTYKDNVLQAATCTATGKSVQVCSTCGKVNEVTTAAAGHSFSAWKDTIVATCVTDGLQTRTCSACGKVESKTVTAGGHTYTTKTVAATCIKHEHTVNTCSGCGDSYITYDDSLYTSWKTYLPDGVDADLVDTKIQSRYRDLESVTSTATSMDGYTLTSTDWVKNATGTIKYVKEWPSGFDTSNSLYSTYNKTPKSASETASAKTTVSEKQIGYLYYHWCYGTLTSGPINRSSRAEKEGEFTAFHAFFSNAEPERVYQDDETTCWQMTNADACTDSYWYWRVPVYEQTYTSYKKQNVFTRWSDWSNWKSSTITASATREVETRTVYRYINAAYGAHNFVSGVCTICGLADDGSGCNHIYSTWKIRTPATCTAAGSKYRDCTLCSERQTETIPATGHDYTSKLVEANCQEYTHVRYTCSACGNSYKTYTSGTGSWSVTKPDTDDLLIETNPQSRYRDLETVTSTATSMDGYTLSSTDWVKNATGTIKYVKEWPSGFDTSNSLYSTYNKTPKSASETASAKTTVSEKQIGYLYYHWCYGTLTSGPINRSSRAEKEGEFTAFHAFFSNAEPERVYQDDETTCWQMTNADACTDSYWYWRVPVYEQTYTSYKKQNVFTRWSDWSAWKTTTYTESDTREVETRTVYRMIPAEYGDHTYVNGFCTICGEEQPAFVCEHEKHTTAGVCVTCSATVEHTYENGCCTICGAVCSHSFVSGVCSICGMTKETSTTLSTYLTNCTAYASHLIVKTTAATSLMTYPCTKAVQSNSSLNAKVAADTTLFVKQLYKNTVGEYWYKVVRYGKTCYVKADDTTLVEHLTGDVTATGISSPASLSYKAGFPIAGTVSSSANLLTTVTGAVHYGADITKVPAISSSDTATNNTYNLASSTIDNNLIFSNLAPGTYTYQITANAKSYYIKDDGTLGSTTKLVDLHRKNMVITDVNNPNTPTGFGIDVSEWNGTINWAKVAKEVDFVILRASWEETADQTFITNANACVANGIPFGVYVYSYAENKAEAVGEAEYVLSLVKNYDLALPIWFDMEDPVHSALSSSMKQEVVRGFCDTITEGGYQPGLYTFIYWFNSYFTDSYYKTLPHWVAQIDGFTSNGTSSYTGGTHMWQYSWVGSISGISGDVDCNYYYAEFDGGSADTSYPTKCTKYPSYLNVTTNGAVEMRKYPCTASVNSGSTLVTTIADATKIVVTGLYKNTNNELWYQVKYNNKNGYVLASSVKFHSFRYDDVVAIDPTMASNIAVGGAYNITGDLTSVYNEMITPFAKVYKNEDLLATQVLTSSENVTTKHYRIDGSTVDAKLYFGSLSEGYYTYELGANVKNYYCKSDGTISSKTESVTTWVQPFTVGSSTISHSHTTATQAAVAATCTTTGLTAGAYCTTCGEITTEQTPVAALGHTAGAPVQENVVENVSYEEVIYCSTCDVQLSRKFVQLQVCEHEKHNQSGACTECGDTVEHTFSNGACTVCGLPCDHVWSGCTCTICGLTVTPGAMSDVTLSGSFNNWATTPNMSIVNGNEVTVTLDLTAGSHTFKVLMDSLTYGNSGTIANSTTGLTMIQNAANTTLQLTYDGTYAFKFNTDTKVISVTAVSVKVPGKLTVDVSGGNGFSITIENGTAKPQGNFYYNSKIDMGTLVQVTAKEIADTTFLGWMDMKTKKIVSTTMSYKFYTSGNDHFSAVYMQEAENANWVVFINDRTNQVMEMQYYAPTDSILFPSSPSSSNYAFNGWQYTEAEIQAKLAKGENVVVNGVWEIIETYVSVSVKNGTITQAASMNDAGKVLANSAVIVTANAAPSGKKFAYWRTSDGTVKSYDTVYRFYPSGNMTLTAVYVLESATVDYTPLVNIDYVDTTTNLTKNSFHISWDVPEEEAGLTYVAAGIVAVNKAYYKEETLVVGSTDTNVYDRRPTTNGNTASNSFVWTKSNVAPGDVWVAKAYVQYKDSNGKLYTIYTDLVEVVKG